MKEDAQMNAFKRSLALLLVIAMMISSFAFAEDVLVMDQSIEALELEEVFEEAEVSGETEEEEPAEEVFTMTDLFAELPIEEEPAVEEVPAEEEESDEIHMDELAGELNSECAHVNFEKYGENKWPGEVLSSDEYGCSFIYDRVAYGHCYDCDSYVEIVLEENLTATNEPHEWTWYRDDYGNLYFHCGICGMDNNCSHEWNVLYSDRNVLEATDNGDGTHRIVCTFWEEKECTLCGCGMWEEYDEPHTIDGESHEFQGLECIWCRAANPCEHKNAFEKGWNEFDESTVHSYDANGHTITAYKGYYYYCPDCYSYYNVTEQEPHIVNQYLPHEYDEGRCWICGYVNTCTHPNFTYYYEGYEVDWDRNDWLISTNATTHTVWAKGVREGECPDCGEWKQEVGDESFQQVEAHYYYNGSKECSLCGYKNTCKHEKTVTTKHISWDDNTANYTKVNNDLHSLTKYVWKYVTCVNCGMETETREDSFVALQKHNFDKNGACDCGYTIACQHKNTATETYENWMSCAYKDSKSHMVTLQTMQDTYCEDCGAYLSTKAISTSTESSNHYFSAGNVCTDCGYVSTCKHSSTTTEEYSWSRYEIVSLDKHQKITYKEKAVFCKTCNGYLRHRSSTSLSFDKAAAHTFKDGVCSTCKMPEPTGACKHVWDNGVCTKCEEICVHSYVNCVCVICGLENHNVVDCVCTVCKKANHVVENCVCTACKQEIHTIENCACTACGKEEHAYENCFCTVCGKEQHTVENCVCTVCGIEAHTFADDICTVCGAADMSVKSIAVKGLDENNTMIVGLKMTQQIVLDVQPAGAEFAAVYATSNKKVATVDENGVITGVAGGKTATITVSPADPESTVAPVSFTVSVVAPSKVKLNASKATLGVGETITIVPTATPDNAPVVFSAKTSNAKVATVEETDEGYVVEGVKAGTAKITVSTQNGKTATCTVTVKAAPTGVKLDKEAIELANGETAKLKATLSGKKAASAITWTSSNEAVATVADGAITTVGAGEATITATTFNGYSASCTVKVWNAVASIEIVNEKLLSVKQKFTPEIKLLDAEGNETIGAYTVSTGNKTYATVSGATITAKKATSSPVAITVKAYNDVEAVCNVAVVAAPTKITATPTKATLGVGEKAEIKVAHTKAEAPTEYSFSVSKKGIVNIEAGEDGVYTVEAVKAGSATITFKTHNGKKATCKITVKAAPTGIKLDKSELDIVYQNTAKLKATLEGKSAGGAITWKSSNENAVTVDANGTVTAVRKGVATITATTYNGFEASCEVEVHWPAQSVYIKDYNVTLSVGQKYTPDVELWDAFFNETIGTYSLKSASKTYAAVSGTTITAKKATKADQPVRIDVILDGEALDSIWVTVVAAPKAVTLPETKLTLAEGEAFQLEPDTNGTPASFTYSSSKKSVATVDANGVVKAVAPGTAKITVKTQNGKKVTCTVTVVEAEHAPSVEMASFLGAEITPAWTRSV